MIGIKIFIGSPNDMAPLRGVVQEVIEQLRPDFEIDDINLSGKDWRSVAGDLGDPQGVIDIDIINADLLILIIGHRLGEGTRKEFELGRKLHAQGRLQSVMYYFQSMTPNMLAAPHAEAQKVIELRERLENKALYHEFSEGDDLRDLVRKHLVRWLAPLRSLRRFQQKYDKKRDKWLTQALNVPNPPPIDEVVSLEGIPWDQELPDGNDVYDYRRYLTSPDGRPYDTHMLGCYRIARYLYRQAIAEKMEVFRDRPFMTFIHRYLADHVRQAREQGDALAERYLCVLRGWLESRSNVFVNARSFAAYQIGMCRDTDGRKTLLAAMEDVNDHEIVRRYAALALGMIRTRDAIAALVDIHDRDETPASLRIAIGHALLASGGLL